MNLPLVRRGGGGGTGMGGICSTSDDFRWDNYFYSSAVMILLRFKWTRDLSRYLDFQEPSILNWTEQNRIIFIAWPGKPQHWRIGGGQGRASPSRSNFFHFHAVFGKKFSQIIDFRPLYGGQGPGEGGACAGRFKFHEFKHVRVKSPDGETDTHN